MFSMRCMPYMHALYVCLRVCLMCVYSFLIICLTCMPYVCAWCDPGVWNMFSFRLHTRIHICMHACMYVCMYIFMY